MSSVDEELFRTQLSRGCLSDLEYRTWLDLSVLSLQDIVAGCGKETNKFVRLRLWLS